MQDLETKRIWSIENLNEDEKKIIQSICPNATRTEMILFFNYCNSLRLDPLRKQIYFIKYGSAVPTIIVSIQGMRIIAGRNKQLAGIERGSIKDKDGKLTGGWAKVHRHDWKVCAHVEVELSEYDSGRGNWKTMPSTMIQKVAEASALRIAFPDELGDVYDESEFNKSKVVKDVESNASQIESKLKDFLDETKETVD